MAKMIMTEKEIASLNRWMRLRNPFPREYGLKRTVVNSLDDIIANWKGVDEYLSIFSKKQIEKEELDTLFFDIDTGYKGYLCFIKKIKKLPSRLYFSGRGIHVFYDLKQSIVGRKVYREFARAVMDSYNLKDIVDSSVVGDVMRMARVPHSINSRSGLYMIELNPKVRYTESMITRLAIWNVIIDNDEPIKYLPDDFKIVEKSIADFEDGVHVRVKVFKKPNDYPPCIKQAISLLKATGALDHAERLVLAMFLVRNEDDKYLFELMRDYAKDFKMDYTKYQINYIKMRNLNIYRCSNIPGVICPYANRRTCKFFPTLNKVWKVVE